MKNHFNSIINIKSYTRTNTLKTILRKYISTSVGEGFKSIVSMVSTLMKSQYSFGINFFSFRNFYIHVKMNVGIFLFQKSDKKKLTRKISQNTIIITLPVTNPNEILKNCMSKVTQMLISQKNFCQKNVKIFNHVFF